MATRQHMSDILNRFLQLARTAKLQYEQHLTLIEHEPAQTMISEIIDEEQRHILWLVTAIRDAGGIPTAHIDELSVPEEFEQMMRVNYDLESEIIKEYELHLGEIWDPQLRSLSEVILGQALRHREQFRGLYEDFGTDELMDRAI